MKFYTFINTKTSLLLILLLFATTQVFAEGLGDLDIDPDVPIDGGLSLLVAAGVGYGAKKIKDKKAKKSYSKVDK
ncbi:MAG: PID-CTERM protein-sorting domain-containing protein [Chitinophagaceae bacterium]